MKLESRPDSLSINSKKMPLALSWKRLQCRQAVVKVVKAHFDHWSN